MSTVTEMIEFSIDREVAGPFDQAVDRLKAALKARGFGTLTEVDVQATLREKIGKEIAPYRILGVCNPGLAAQALEAEPRIGVFLPCTVVVRESGGRVLVHAQDPGLMERIVVNPELAPLAQATRAGIVEALEGA